MPRLPSYHFVKYLSQYAGTLGLCLAAVNSLAVALEAMENALLRWVVWGIAAVLLATGAFLSKGETSAIILPADQQLMRRNPLRGLLLSLTAVVLTVLIGDVLIVSLRAPVKWTPMTVQLGMLPDFETPNSYSIAAVDETVTIANQEFGTGICAASTLTRQQGIDHALIRDLTIEVVRFEKMPAVASAPAGLEQLDSLDATFILEEKQSELPWTFSSTELLLNQDGEARLPVRVTDSAPFTLAYWIKARNPGVYWVKCIAWVSNGISPAKRIELTSEAIPLGYFESESRFRTQPVDESAPQFETLPSAQ